METILHITFSILPCTILSLIAMKRSGAMCRKVKMKEEPKSKLIPAEEFLHQEITDAAKKILTEGGFTLHTDLEGQDPEKVRQILDLIKNHVVEQSKLHYDKTPEVDPIDQVLAEFPWVKITEADTFMNKGYQNPILDRLKTTIKQCEDHAKRHRQQYAVPPLVASPYCSTGFLTANRGPVFYLHISNSFITLKNKTELSKIQDPITILNTGQLSDHQRDAMAQLYKRVKTMFNRVDININCPRSTMPRYIDCNVSDMENFALDYLVAQACGFEPQVTNPLVLVKDGKQIYVGDYPQIDAELFSPTRLWKDCGPLFEEFPILVESSLLNHAVVKNNNNEYYEDSFKRSHVDGEMTVAICKAIVSYQKDVDMVKPQVPNCFLENFEGIGVNEYIELCQVTITDYKGE